MRRHVESSAAIADRGLGHNITDAQVAMGALAKGTNRRIRFSRTRTDSETQRRVRVPINFSPADKVPTPDGKILSLGRVPIGEFLIPDRDGIMVVAAGIVDDNTTLNRDRGVFIEYKTDEYPMGTRLLVTGRGKVLSHRNGQTSEEFPPNYALHPASTHHAAIETVEGITIVEFVIDGLAAGLNVTPPPYLAGLHQIRRDLNHTYRANSLMRPDIELLRRKSTPPRVKR